MVQFFKKVTSLVLSSMLFVGTVLSAPIYTVHAENRPAPSTQANDASSYVPEVTNTGKTNIPTQTYIVPQGYYGEGEQRTIYWAKGIKPPKMSQNPNDFGKPGYFYTEREQSNLDSNRFSYTFETGANMSSFQNPGFYDVNKSNKNFPGQRNLCYLATSANLIHWWMDQNAEHIKKYKAGLESGRYVQEEGLVSLSTTDIFDKLSAPPDLKLQYYSVDGQLYWMQSIPSSYVAGTILYPEYRNIETGGWMDSVFAFFINGYPGKQNVQTMPNPEKFTPSKKGGYFHPIFGKTPLAIRHEYQSYEFYSTHFKKWLEEGKGIGIAYDPKSNGGGSHAVTLWGAEYDEKGNLCRVYLTDSDDANFEGKTPENYRDGMHSKTMYSYDIVAVPRGDGTHEMKFTVNHKTLYSMQGAVEVSLGEEFWEAAEKDTDPTPGLPLAHQPENRTYGYGAKSDALCVDASIPEKDRGKGGYLTYQWYKTNKQGTEKALLRNETNAKFYPPIGNAANTEYYVCEVTNHKYGKKAVWTSKPIEIRTLDEPFVDTATPVLLQDFQPVTCYANSQAQITVHADAQDLQSGGTLTYQWFRNKDMTGTLFDPVTEPSTSPVFTIPTDTVGKATYYCRIVNTNLNATGHRSIAIDLWNNPLQVTVRENPNPTVQISFSATEGYGQMQPITVQVGSSFSLPDCLFIAPKGKKFKQWNVGKPGDVISINRNMEITPQWEDGVMIYGSGSCGSNLYWSLSSDGMLSIYGQGVVPSYTSGNAPWFPYKNFIKIVTFEEGITCIPNNLLEDCPNLSYVRFPNSANYIDMPFLTNAPHVITFVIPNSYAASLGFQQRFSGDTNGDGVITSADYDALLQECIQYKSGSLKEESFEAGDINGDGVIDAFDLALCNRLLCHQ